MAPPKRCRFKNRLLGMDGCVVRLKKKPFRKALCEKKLPTHFYGTLIQCSKELEKKFNENCGLQVFARLPQRLKSTFFEIHFLNTTP